MDVVYLPLYFKGLGYYYQGCGIFEPSSVLICIFKKQITVEILHGIYKKDIGYSSVDFQVYRILMTPPSHIPPPPPPPSYPIQASPFLMHVNEYALFCLWATGPMRLSQASGREFRMNPGLCTMYKVFSETFPGFFGNKRLCSLVFSF